MTFKLDYSSLGYNLNEITHALRSYYHTNILDLYASSDSQVSYQGTVMGKGYKALDKCYQWIHLNFSSNDLDKTLEFIILNQFNEAVKNIYKLKCRYIAFQVRRLERAISNNPRDPQEGMGIGFA